MDDHRTVTLLVIVATTLLTIGSIGHAEPIAIQRVNLVPFGESRMAGGVRIENSRSLAETAGGTQLTYDNRRFRYLDLRMGLLDNIEVNMEVNYARNSANTNNPSTPDEQGLEGIDLGTKLHIHPNISAQFTGKFNSSSDVHPYGSDDPSFSANIPIQFEVGDGMFHGEAGLTLQSGDVTDGNSNIVGSWSDYLNYGMGYSYESNHFTDISMELFGHTPTAESNMAGLEYNSHLALLFGADVRLARGVYVRPSTGIGLMEGSPDLMFGLDYEIAFEGRHFRRTERDIGEERYSNRAPVGMAEPRAQTEPDTLPTGTMQDQQPRDTESKADRLRRLMEKGYRAAEAGELQKALNFYGQAETIAPNNLLVQSNLGSLHYRMGNYKQSRDHYRKAVKINSNDTFSLLYLGASHYQLGNDQVARRYFERVKRLDPDNDRVDQWLEKME